jgi:hypothetical protein
MQHKNSVHEAVYRIGGPLYASIFLKVSTASIHRWIKKGFIRRYDKAVLLSKASGLQLEQLRPTSFRGFYG